MNQLIKQNRTRSAGQLVVFSALTIAQCFDVVIRREFGCKKQKKENQGDPQQTQIYLKMTIEIMCV